MTARIVVTVDEVVVASGAGPRPRREHLAAALAEELSRRAAPGMAAAPRATALLSADLEPPSGRPGEAIGRAAGRAVAEALGR